MTGTPNDTREKLEETLLAYGSKIERWPLDLQAELEPLLRADVSAQRLLANAKALDAALLTEKPILDDQAAALSARIMAAAARTQQAPPRSLAASPQLKIIDGGKPSLPAPKVSTTNARSSASVWLPLTTLAASLMLGLILGAQDFGQNFDFDGTAELETGDLAFGISGAAEEDVL